MWFVNISLGSVTIPFSETLKSLIGHTLENETWQTIITRIRIPKSLTAIIVGSGLSVTGLLMQTLFRNPMAGPSVLGVSSGASLGVAFLFMGSSVFGLSHWEDIGFKMGIVISAIIGAMSVLLLIMLLSLKLKNTLSVLIIGLMLSALTSSVVSVLSFFSSSQQLQMYFFWGFGNLGTLEYSEILSMALVVGIGILLVLPLLKPLNSFLLGENIAKSLGVNSSIVKNSLLVITGIIVGVITAYVGPIAFIGLAVPHIARLIFKSSDHKVLLPSVILLGSFVMLLCDTISQLPFSEKVIPINAVTSLIGAPIVIILILKQKKYQI
jgi:iron complex transport system permease protein